MPRTKVVFEVVVIALRKGFMSVVRDLHLDIDQAEKIFKKAQSQYAQNPYDTAIWWESPLDDEAQKDLHKRFRHDLSQWIIVHGLEDGLSGMLHRYLREETREQLETVARERQKAILRPKSNVVEPSDQDAALTA